MDIWMLLGEDGIVLYGPIYIDCFLLWSVSFVLNWGRAESLIQLISRPLAIQSRQLPAFPMAGPSTMTLYIECSRLYGWFDCLGSIEDNCLLFKISLILLIHDSHFTKYSEEYKICTSLSLNILYDVKGSGKIWKNCKISSQNILDNGKKSSGTDLEKP